MKQHRRIPKEIQKIVDRWITDVMKAENLTKEQAEEKLRFYIIGMAEVEAKCKLIVDEYLPLIVETDKDTGNQLFREMYFEEFQPILNYGIQEWYLPAADIFHLFDTMLMEKLSQVSTKEIAKVLPMPKSKSPDKKLNSSSN
jgi:hypothetical protein